MVLATGSYFGENGNTIVVLLSGGDKRSQAKDIVNTAKKYWKEYHVAMRKLRTLDAVEADYLRDHPEEMEEYMSVSFEEYARDGNTGALLASLRTSEQGQRNHDDRT